MPASSFTGDTEPSPNGLFDHNTTSVPRASVLSRGALRRTGLERSSREGTRKVDEQAHSEPGSTTDHFGVVRVGERRAGDV